jgi:hypothetical protein
VTFVASSVYYYIALSGTYFALLEGVDSSTANMTPQLWQIVSQFARNLIAAFVLAYLIARLGITSWKGAVQLG